MIQEANLHWRYVDTESNLVLPWYTLPALEWLKKQDVKNWLVWEYGSGYSTIWWRANCKLIQSVESDPVWGKAMGAYNCEYEGGYIQSCLRNEDSQLWDCIIVDGIYREECTEFCLKFLKPGGVLIIDNYGSEDYDIARTEDLLKVWPREIHKQPNHSSWATAIFFKP